MKEIFLNRERKKVRIQCIKEDNFYTQEPFKVTLAFNYKSCNIGANCCHTGNSFFKPDHSPQVQPWQDPTCLVTTAGTTMASNLFFIL